MEEFSENLQNKILFFFMPEMVTFFKPLKSEDSNSAILKSICPYFYWCSAHEFTNFNKNNKFLFQYQVYSIENKKIVPGEVIQEWHENKNGIKISIINFIEKWEDHKRIILGKYSDSNRNANEPNNIDNLFDDENAENKNINIDNFMNFAKFVAKSIIGIQDVYIKECEARNFDFLQKKFWESMALYYQSVLINFNKSKTSTIKKTKKRIPKKAVNKKNETISNKRSK